MSVDLGGLRAMRKEGGHGADRAQDHRRHIRRFGTESEGMTPDRIEELVREHFDLRPAAILRDLELQRPIYAKTAAYGHFGREDRDFTWERTDKAEALRAAAGLGEQALATSAPIHDA